MKLINRMNIKSKLGVLFFILFFSILILGYTSIQISESSKEKLKIVHDTSQKVLILQDKIISPLYRLREISQSLVMAPNAKLRVGIERDLNGVLADVEKEFLRYKKQNRHVYTMWREYRNLIAITKKYIDNDFEEGAYINVSTSSKNQFNLLMNELLVIQSKSLNNAKFSYATAVEESKKLKLEIMMYLALILIIAIILGLLVSHSIMSSIYAVQQGLSEFFDYLNHKKNKAKKIQLKSKDEFSQMADIINLNVQKIQNDVETDEALIRDATEVLINIKGGNLGRRLTKETNNSALSTLKLKMNTMIDNLEEKIQDEIHQRLQQEQMLIQQSKLASMGEMIGNIAHQWRQPISEISAILMNMKVTHDFDNFTNTYMDSKMKEANTLIAYMSQTISDFQNFFKPQGDKELFSIETACKEAYFIVESSLKYYGIQTRFNVQEDIEVFGHKNEYAQVILNILSNAKDIILERDIQQPYINIEIKEGEHFAIVKIEDNGGGVDEDIIEKIFEPYFTTRYKTKGTGIGLYMSKNIIEQNMNGYINVKNTQKGVCFTIKVEK